MPVAVAVPARTVRGLMTGMVFTPYCCSHWPCGIGRSACYCAPHVIAPHMSLRGAQRRSNPGHGDPPDEGDCFVAAFLAMTRFGPRCMGRIVIDRDDMRHAAVV